MEDIDYNSVKVFIQEDYSFGTIKIWIRERSVTSDINIHFDGNKLVKTEIIRGSIPDKNLKPFLDLPVGFAQLLFDNITDYTTKSGRKTENQNFAQGKLQATELHLQDMKLISEKLLNFVTKIK